MQPNGLEMLKWLRKVCQENYSNHLSSIRTIENNNYSILIVIQNWTTNFSIDVSLKFIIWKAYSDVLERTNELFSQRVG